jgi:hypothetical protein
VVVEAWKEQLKATNLCVSVKKKKNNECVGTFFYDFFHQSFI